MSQILELKRYLLYAAFCAILFLFVSSIVYISSYVINRSYNFDDINRMNGQEMKDIHNMMSRQGILLERVASNAEELAVINDVEGLLALHKENYVLLLDAINQQNKRLEEREALLSEISDNIEHSFSVMLDQQTAISERFATKENEIAENALLEVQISSLTSTISLQRYLLEEILAESRGSASVNLSDSLKSKISDAIDGAKNLQIGGPNDEGVKQN